VGAPEAEKESGGLQEDTGGSFGVEGGADILSRLKKRFTGGFSGFDPVEKEMEKGGEGGGRLQEEKEEVMAMEEVDPQEMQSKDTEEGNVRIQCEENGKTGKP